MNDFLFKDEGYQRIGAALEVYNEQGHHLSEDIYQASLEAELQRRKIPYDPQLRLDVYYKWDQTETVLYSGSLRF
jgi:GxxExxY protein